MNREEFLEYFHSEEGKRDYAEASRLIKKEDWEGLAKFISRGNKCYAKKLAKKARINK